MACASAVKVAAISMLVILCTGSQLMTAHAHGTALLADGQDDAGARGTVLRLMKPMSLALELAEKVRQGWLHDCSEECQTCKFVCACQNCGCGDPTDPSYSPECERECIEERGCNNK